MQDRGSQKTNVQLIWGIALILVGIAVFIRIPQVMPALEKMGPFGGFSRFGLYLMGVILIGGGLRKIVAYVRTPSAEKHQISDENKPD